MHRQAIEVDPRFAAPHAGLALAAISEYASGWAADPAQALDEAERWARRALELDPQEPVSHMALGNVLLWRRQHDAALAEFRQMTAIDPNFAQGHMATGFGADLCGPAGGGAGSLRLRHAARPALSGRSCCTSSRRRISRSAITRPRPICSSERIARNPATDSSRMLLASCYGHLGRIDEARAAWAEMLKVNPDFSLAQRERVLPYKDPRDFQRIVEGLAKAGLA